VPAVPSDADFLLTIRVEGRDHKVLIDSGASLSIFKPGVSSAEIVPTNQVARGVTGNLLEIIGSQKVVFTLGTKAFDCEFMVAPLDVEYSGIFGTDVLRHGGNSRSTYE
jgi:hypothetical protein